MTRARTDSGPSVTPKQSPSRIEGHDWKIVGLFLHIFNRPKNPLVPNATRSGQGEQREPRCAEAGDWAASYAGATVVTRTRDRKSPIEQGSTSNPHVSRGRPFSALVPGIEHPARFNQEIQAEVFGLGPHVG